MSGQLEENLQSFLYKKSLFFLGANPPLKLKEENIGELNDFHPVRMIATSLVLYPLFQIWMQPCARY